MSLQGIAAGLVAAINPPVSVTYRQSTGMSKDASYKPVPAYAADVTVSAQMQALTSRELARINALNIQGTVSALYVSGIQPRGADRSKGTGGDLFIINNDTWLVVQVLEQWADWSRVAICRQ